MQPVPGAPQADVHDAMPENDVLPSDPDVSVNDLTEELGHREHVDEYDPSTALEHEKHWSLLILEGILGLFFFLLPAVIVSLSGGFEEYSLVAQKGPSGLGAFREFQRWCIFLGVAYFIIVTTELVFRWLPWLIFKFLGWMGKELTRGERTAIWCLRYASHYLGMVAALFLIFNWAELLLYESSTNLAARQVFSRLDWKQRVKAYELMQGERIESFLAATFMFVLCLALEKYLVAAIHASFHRLALEPRIEALNKKFVVLAHLYRQCVQQHSRISRQGEESTPEEDAKLTGHLTSISATKSKAVSKTIFGVLCPAERNYITAHDFRPFFSSSDYEEAFNFFDSSRKGQMNRFSLKKAIAAIYDERIRVMKTIIANRHIINKLDYVLATIASIFGALFALIVFNHKGYGWVTSLGTFILGFSFLFQTTVARVFDTFLFVFVEHAYDVADNVVVDNERLSAHEIEIFTTIFVRNDGVIVYSPNSTLKGKTIYNKQRMRSEMDEIFFAVSADAAVEKIIKMRSKITDYLTETINEFTGVVAVSKMYFRETDAKNRVYFKVEPKYRPREDDLRSDQFLRERRANLLERFHLICEDLQLEATLENPIEA